MAGRVSPPTEARDGYARRSVVPLAYTRSGAAASLGVSVDTFDKYVRSYIRCVYVGSLRIYPVSELRRWLEQNLVKSGADGVRS